MGKIVTRAQQQYVSTGIGSGEKQLAYVLRSVRYSTMGDSSKWKRIVPKRCSVARCILVWCRMCKCQNAVDCGVFHPSAILPRHHIGTISGKNAYKTYIRTPKTAWI